MLHSNLRSLRCRMWPRSTSSQVHRLRRYRVSICLEFWLLPSSVLQQLSYLLQVLLNRTLPGS